MELFYRKYGEGKPVIILHGLFGMSDNWATFSKKLAAENFTVYTPDLRNHGNSPHSEDFNYTLLADDLNEFIQQHELSNPILIGHSMGGKVIMNFALKYPVVAKKMIIIDMGIKKYKIHNDDLLNAMAITKLSAMGSRTEIEEALHRIIPTPKVVQLLMKNVQRNEENIFSWKINIASLLNNFHEIFSAVDDRQTVEIPALFVAAEISDYLSEADLPSIKKIFPSAEMITISGSSHWVHADKPDELLKIIQQFEEK
jgi:esterase